MQYGIGASYALSKRLSIRTGFFAGYKTYTADSADYKTPYVINDLQKVDADCFVYEIPEFRKIEKTRLVSATTSGKR